MKTAWKRILVASIAAVAVPGMAAITFDFDTPASVASKTYTFSNLGSNTVVSAGTIVAGDSLTIAATNTETFTMTVTAVTNWSNADAIASGDINAYLGSRTAANWGGNSAGIGPNAGTALAYDKPGEALICTFDLSGLSAESQANFRMTAWAGANLTTAGDLFDWAVIDASANSFAAYASGLTTVGSVSQNAFAAAKPQVGNGDIFVLAYRATTTAVNKKLATVSFDIAPPPTPYNGMRFNFDEPVAPMSKTYTFISLGAAPVATAGTIVPGASLADAANLGSESFSMTVTAVTNWSNADAITSGDINAYLGSRTATNWGGNAAGIGPSAGVEKAFDSVGEALIFTFNLSGLSAEHQANFKMTAWAGANLVAEDLFDTAVVDISSNSLSFSTSGQSPVASMNALAAADPLVGNGDRFVIAYQTTVGASSKKLATMTFNIFGAASAGGYAAWATTYNAGAATDNPDNDAYLNFYEYATGGNPTNAGDVGLDPVAASASAAGLVYVHRERTDTADLLYTIQSRTGLVAGDWAPATNATFVGEGVIGENIKAVTNLIPAVQSAEFINLKIDQL